MAFPFFRWKNSALSLPLFEKRRRAKESRRLVCERSITKQDGGIRKRHDTDTRDTKAIQDEEAGLEIFHTGKNGLGGCVVGGVMMEQLGQKLRQWRTSRGLTLEQVAQLAGIGRVTLNRWETGVQQPRLGELEALLTALKIEANQRRQAVALVQAPRAQAQTRAQCVQMGEQLGIGAMPSGGDLLRAIRLRRGLSTEELAGKIGVTARTLQRWESGQIVPSREALDALCTLLHAAPGERLALQQNDLFSVPPLRMTFPSEDAVEERLIQCFYVSVMAPEDPLNDLGFLTLAADAWQLAARGARGRERLVEVYAKYASFLSGFSRFAEAEHYANRALDLRVEKRMPDSQMVRAAIAAAQASVYRSVHPMPRRGLEMLRMWLPLTENAAYRAWILSDMAEYLALDGATESALAAAEEACRVAEQHHNPSELRLRRLDLAHLQAQVGEPETALALTEYREDDGPFRRAEITLLRAEALWKLGDSSEAQTWFERAYSDITAYDLTHLRAAAETLAKRF
jgi:transcriptional regulator with XRE-family HTH domain